MPDWELFVAAAFAPVAVWVLWRLQILSVELLRTRLLVLTRHWDQKWIYNIVSWFGTFLHEVSHGLVLLLSGHGIKQFRAGVEEGHVLPARMRKGPFAFFSFLLAALAPLFIPPLLVLAAIVFLLDVSLPPFGAGAVGISESIDLLRDQFIAFPKAILIALGNLDLATWQGAVVVAAVILGIPGARPSHVKAQKWHGSDEGDVAVLRRTIRHNPIPFLCFVAIVYGAYFALVPWRPDWYWDPFQAIWVVAITGILLACFGAVWWTLVGLDGRVSAFVAWVSPALFVIVQVAARLLDWPLSILEVNLASLGAWLASALILGLVVPRR